jgi:6-phosphogluconolactonase (cycloisomerase 2 family)
MRVWVVVLLLALALWGGCGGSVASSGHSGSIGPASETYVYVSDRRNRTIAGFLVNTDSGSLSALRDSPFAFTGDEPGRMATNANGRLLFVADGAARGFSTYQIDPVTGILISLGTTATEDVPQDIATDPASNFVYVLSTTRISAFRFDTISGVTIPVPESPFPVGTGAGTADAQRLAIDSAGSFVYVSNGTEILSYTIGTDGSLRQVNRFAQSGAPLAGIAVAPRAPFVYAASPVSGVGQRGGVFVYSTDSTGTLTPVAGSPFSAGVSLRELATDTDGDFVAAAGGPLGAGMVALFKADAATGQLALAPQAPVLSPPDPVQLAFDPLAHFLYSANSDLSASSLPSVGGNVSGFLIDSRTFSLIPVRGSPFPISAPAGLVCVRPAP